MWDEPLDSKDVMPLWEYWDVSVNNYWDVINKSTVSIFCLISVLPTLSKSCSKVEKKQVDLQAPDVCM